MFLWIVHFFNPRKQLLVAIKSNKALKLSHVNTLVDMDRSYIKMFFWNCSGRVINMLQISRSANLTINIIIAGVRVHDTIIFAVKNIWILVLDSRFSAPWFSLSKFSASVCKLWFANTRQRKLWCADPGLSKWAHENYGTLTRPQELWFGGISRIS